MRPEATRTAFLLEIEEDGLVQQIVVMVERDGEKTLLKKLERAMAGWPGEVVSFKALDGYLEP